MNPLFNGRSSDPLYRCMFVFLFVEFVFSLLHFLSVLCVGKHYQGSVPFQQQTAGESTVSAQDFQSRLVDLPTAPQCSASIPPSEYPVDFAGSTTLAGVSGCVCAASRLTASGVDPEEAVNCLWPSACSANVFHTIIPKPQNSAAQWDLLQTDGGRFDLNLPLAFAPFPKCVQG